MTKNKQIQRLEAKNEDLQAGVDILLALLRESRDALRANRVFHSPIANRKLNGAGGWDEYQTDAIERTGKSLSAGEGK